MKAAYNLFSHPRATPDNLQRAHRQDVMRSAREADKTFLFLQDSSTISFTGREEIRGLGPVSHGECGQQGYHMNSVLVAGWKPDSHAPEALRRRPPLEVVGLADQQLYARIARPQEEGVNEKKKRLKRHRESEYWGWATERMGRVPKGCDWVRVVDAEGDIYPFLMECLEFGYSFLVRSGQNRALWNETGRYLSDVAGEAPALGSFEIFARARDDKPARMMRLNIATAKVALRPPYRVGGQVKQEEPLRCNAIRVWEENPPAGQEALEWILLTDRKAETFDEAHEISLMYCSRWLIEEFHKALKSGLGAERLQLESGEGLMAAGAIMAVVAVRLVQLKENARLIPEEAAHRAGLSAVELRVLRAMIEEGTAHIKRPKKNREIVTVRDVILAVGCLGGHKGRKGDGLPGWQTLWSGMTALMRVVEGVNLAKKLNGKI